MRFVFLGLTLALTQLAQAGQRGVINDPDGYVNVREGKSVEAAVIATAKTGEPFIFDWEEGAEWCKVTLAAGKSGWMHYSRIRLHFTEEDLPAREKDPAGASEIEEFARARGFDYATVTRRAARGDAKALKQFFMIAEDVDGAAAEMHLNVPTAVYHILGDEVREVPGRATVGVSGDGEDFDLERRSHLSRNRISTAPFSGHNQGSVLPRNRRLVFSNERYAIRKVFSDEFNLSAVVAQS